MEILHCGGDYLHGIRNVQSLQAVLNIYCSITVAFLRFFVFLAFLYFCIFCVFVFLEFFCIFFGVFLNFCEVAAITVAKLA